MFNDQRAKSKTATIEPVLSPKRRALAKSYKMTIFEQAQVCLIKVTQVVFALITIFRYNL